MPEPLNIPQSAHDATPHHTKGILLRIAGIAIMALGALPAIALFLWLLAKLHNVKSALFGGALLFVPFFALGQWLFKQSRANRAIGAIETLKHDLRPPILYLRSFADDATTYQNVGGGGTSEEELVAAGLQHIGPLVAIGKPSEGIPRPGAARLYVSDEEWQQAVEELMARSRLVLLRVGTTQGLWWEIARSVHSLKPEQLLLLVPFDHISYATFREEAAKVFPKPFPEHPMPFGNPVASIHATISFLPDWTPSIHPAEAQVPDVKDLHAVQNMLSNSVRVAWSPSTPN